MGEQKMDKMQRKRPKYVRKDLTFEKGNQRVVEYPRKNKYPCKQ